MRKNLRNALIVSKWVAVLLSALLGCFLFPYVKVLRGDIFIEGIPLGDTSNNPGVFKLNPYLYQWERMTPDHMSVGNMKLSPNGENIAFTYFEDKMNDNMSNTGIALVNIHTFVIQKIYKSSGEVVLGQPLAWSPDLQFVYFFDQSGNLRKVNIETKEASIFVLPAGTINWSSIGSFVVSPQGDFAFTYDAVYVASPDFSDIHQLTYGKDLESTSDGNIIRFWGSCKDETLAQAYCAYNFSNKSLRLFSETNNLVEKDRYIAIRDSVNEGGPYFVIFYDLKTDNAIKIYKSIRYFAGEYSNTEFIYDVAWHLNK